MALRIAREKVYLPLPMDKRLVLDLQGNKDYYVPIGATGITEEVLDVLRGFGMKAVAWGLVIQCADEKDVSDVTVEHEGHRVAYNVLCGIAMRNGIPHLHLRHIEPVDFGLYWVNGKFFQLINREEQSMKRPTQEQMAAVANVAKGLLSKHKITVADWSQTNPYLFALIIPMSVEKAKVKAFANDLFHSLNLLSKKYSMNVEQANKYCALDADRGHECYLVIFNHPAIFDYLEDSPEGRCAYGVWRTIAD